MVVPLILAAFVGLPALLAFVVHLRSVTEPFSVGAPILYCRHEIATQPVATARNVRPAEHGEFYSYEMIDYLRVVEVMDDGRIIAIEGTKNRICFWPNDPQFRRAGLAERLIHHWRFPIAHQPA